MHRPLCTLHLVRHGETTANRKGIIQGHQDYDLTPLGVNQAVATAARLGGNTYWQAHSSDLKRASRTADIILEEHPGATLSRTPLLREFALGAQEGLPRGTTWNKARAIKAQEAGVSLDDYEESLRESPADVQQRAQQFLDRLVADAMKAEKTPADTAAEAAAAAAAVRLALVVAHGGILNVMMLTEMHLDGAVIMSNCAVAVVDVFQEKGGGGGRGVRYVPRLLNDLSHFDESELPVGSAQVENFGR